MNNSTFGTRVKIIADLCRYFRLLVFQYNKQYITDLIIIYPLQKKKKEIEKKIHVIYIFDI